MEHRKMLVSTLHEMYNMRTVDADHFLFVMFLTLKEIETSVSTQSVA